MAFLTDDLLLDMPLVVEENMLRQIIDFDPGGRRPGIKVPVLLLDLRVIRDDVFVTVKTLLYRRYAGKMGSVHVWMAELTLNPLHAGMYLVAEGDGLLRAQASTGHHIEAVKKNKGQSQTAQG
jgi:hypothetical protein